VRPADRGVRPVGACELRAAASPAGAPSDHGERPHRLPGVDAMSETAPWWAAGGAFALWATREIWGVVASRRKDRAETDANIDLVTGLAARVKSLEESQGSITAQLNEEIQLRRAAQEE